MGDQTKPMYKTYKQTSLQSIKKTKIKELIPLPKKKI